MVWVIAACAVLGALNALVFTGLILGKLKASSPLVSRVCRMDSRDCETVISSPRARLAGVPNSAVGLVWYLICIGWAIWATSSRSLYALDLMVLLSTLSVAAGAYLTWHLAFVLRVHCKFCYLGHALNLIIWLSLARLWQG